MSPAIAVLAASATTFAATNLDDLFLPTVFFARRVPTRRVVAGQYVGLSAIVNECFVECFFGGGDHASERSGQYRGLRAIVHRQPVTSMVDFGCLRNVGPSLVCSREMARESCARAEVSGSLGGIGLFRLF
jgi:hypothetical protein